MLNSQPSPSSTARNDDIVISSLLLPRSILSHDLVGKIKKKLRNIWLSLIEINFFLAKSMAVNNLIQLLKLKFLEKYNVGDRS
jgi:hypothetical protein